MPGRPAVREIDTPVGVARATWMSRSTRVTLVMGHGAGGGIDAPDLQELAWLGAERGLGVVLVEQPWRVAGRKIAVAPPQLDAAWLAILPALRPEGRLVVGGRSAGARVAARTAVPLRRAGLEIAGALLLSFPLHAPGRPEATRADELGELRNRVRTLVVQGTRDAFGTDAEVREVSTATVVSAEGADHSLRPTGRSGPAVLAALERAVRWADRLGE